MLLVRSNCSALFGKDSIIVKMEVPSFSSQSLSLAAVPIQDASDFFVGDDLTFRPPHIFRRVVFHVLSSALFKNEFAPEWLSQYPQINLCPSAFQPSTKNRLLAAIFVARSYRHDLPARHRIEDHHTVFPGLFIEARVTRLDDDVRVRDR